MQELLGLLQSLPEGESLALLNRLRASEDASVALSGFKAEGGSSGSRNNYVPAILPPSQTSLEFELMMRHPIAYPTLVPVEAALIVGATTMSRPATAAGVTVGSTGPSGPDQ